MLPLLRTDRKPSKCLVTHGPLPSFIDPKQPPTKKRPFAAISVHIWYHTVDMIIPASEVDNVQKELADTKKTPMGDSITYARVMMKLGEVVEGEFFDHYIKKGNILMLSEGRPGIDNRYELSEGTLRLELDKATYERVGLVGKPIQDLGRKHTKTRYAIEIDLRRPSMLHGKKGFERIVWAFKNVLNATVTWLFYDCAPAVVGEGSVSPIEKHHPTWLSSHPTKHTLPAVRIPDLHPSTITTAMTETPKSTTYLSDLEEWLSLVALRSPRVQLNDHIDPFLCRYSLPSPSGYDTLEEESREGVDLAILRWHGFLPHSFVMGILLRGVTARGGFAAVQASGFRGGCVSVLRLPGEEGGGGEKQYLCWEHAPPV